MKCENVKRGWRKANSWHMDLSRGLVSHEGTPTSTLSKHSQKVLFHGNQVSSMNTITVTLIPLSTKELHQEGWRSPCPPHKECRRRSTPRQRVVDVAGEPPRLQGWPTHRVQAWAALKNNTQGTQPCSHTQTWASLALSHKVELDLRMWSICFMDGLEMFFNVCSTSLNFSNFKMARGEALK